MGGISAPLAELMEVVVTGAYGPESEYEALRAAGHRVRFGASVIVQSDPTAEEMLIALGRDADVIVPAYRDFITAAVIEQAERLRMVVVPFIGVDRVDVEAASKRGVLVCNSPRPENFVGVAEATIGAVLMLLKRVKHNEAKLRAGAWRVPRDYGDVLFGKTVGLVGLGRIGSQVARRLVAWDVRLLASDPYVPEGHFLRFGTRRVDLHTLLREADVVSLHVVLTSETYHMIGARELALMKPSAILINTARGGVVDEAALAAALRERRLAGAALDTFEVEPLPALSPLRALDPAHVILTPHDIGQSDAARRANTEMAIETVMTVARGRLPDSVLNPEVIPAWQKRFGVRQESRGSASVEGL